MSLGSYFFYCTIPCVLYLLDVYRSTLRHRQATTLQATTLFDISYTNQSLRYSLLLTQSTLRLCMLYRTRALPALLLLALVRMTISHFMCNS